MIENSLSDSRFGTWIYITQSLKRIQQWEVQKFKAQKFVLSRASIGFSRLELNFIKNDFTLNIHTYKTIIEHNCGRNYGHVSKSGKLFCIFPLGKEKM